jgi:cytochrome c-type biogenesis protein
MTLLILSFIAGILTVTAPCVLIFLPVILGGSVVGKRSMRRPLVITASLVVSVVAFTLLLRATTTFLGIPQIVWQLLSGIVVILLGLHYLGVPIWERFTGLLHLPQLANKELSKASRQQGNGGAILTGAALGPVFASCSPTFAFIVAAVIPADFILGLIYLVVYAFGMAVTLLAVAYLGQAILGKLRALNNPKGWLPRVIGVIFIVVGLTIVTGLDKSVQTFVLQQGWYDPITTFENNLMNK